jgi:phage terminase large subunit
MPTIYLDYDPAVFNDIYYPYLDDETRMQIYFGGSSSGKSYFLAQRCILDMVKGGHNYLIVRKVANTVRRSVYNEITKAISFFKLDKYFESNKSDMVITCYNGYQILFCGLDDPEKVKSITPGKGVITDVWYEEATEADYDDIKQLEKRLRGQSQVKKRIILSFNPVYKTHWLFNEYFASRWRDDKQIYHDNDLLILKTTYRDNKFLTIDDINALINERDPYYKAVYSEGAWGVLGKVIFTNWTTADLSETGKHFSTFQNGCDFGYADDPAAIVHLHYDRAKMTLYVLDARYCYGCTNDLLAAEIHNVCGNQVIVCDSSEPKSIAELRRYKASATPAIKGKDSVNFGIQWLQQIQIIVDYRLKDAINEFTVYKWREDKDGNVLPEPVDKNNHIIDAIRYALEHEMGRHGRNDGESVKVTTTYNPYQRVQRRR